MSREVKIPVPGQGLVTHDGLVTEVVLREPRYAEVFALGDPRSICGTPDGTSFVHINGAIVAAYVEKCLVAPKNPAFLEQGGGLLALRIRAAVLRFFQNGSMEEEPSVTSETTSSSDSKPDATAPSTSPA